MALSNYDDLQSTLLTILESPMVGEDVTNHIRLAEADIFPMIKHYMMEKTVTMTTANNTITWPDDFQEARVVRVNGKIARLVSAYGSELCSREIGYFQRSNTYVFVPAIDEPRTVELTYSANPANLSDDNPTNWLLTKFPDVYQHAALVRAYRFRRDQDGEAAEQASLGMAFGKIAQDHKRAVGGGNTIIMNNGGPYYVD